MNRAQRWLLVAVALAIAAALALWVERSIEWVDDEIPIPPSGEAARDPLYAAKQLAAKLGARVTTIRSFEQLPPGDATLVLLSPRWAMFPGRDAALRRWVEQGGRLVALQSAWSSAGEAPAWVPIRGRKPSRPSGAASAASRPAAAASDPMRAIRELALAPCRRYAEPDGSPGAFGDPRSYLVCGRPAFALRAATASWRIDGDAGAVAVRVAVGKGTVTSTALEASLDNGAVLRDDGPLAFAALLQIVPGDAVWFLVDEARAPFLRALWQHGAPALLLAAAAIALALWRAATRFGPRLVDPAIARRSIGEQVRRTAAFIAGGGGQALHRASVRALDGAARRAIAGYAGLVGARERSDAIARKTGVDPAALAAAMSPEPRRNRKTTATAIHELERARRALASVARRPLPPSAPADASTP